MVCVVGTVPITTTEGEVTARKEHVGVPGRIRTRDPLLRRQPLYPTELQGLDLNVMSLATDLARGQRKEVVY